MGMNDAAEMLEVAKDECIRLENELKSAHALITLLAAANGGSVTVTDEALSSADTYTELHTEYDPTRRLTRFWVSYPERDQCTCTQTPPEMHTRYGSAVEPGSTLEPNPDCTQHFPIDERTFEDAPESEQDR